MANLIQKRNIILGQVRNVVTQIINTFRARVQSDAGTLEADSCLRSTITNLRNIDLA